MTGKIVRVPLHASFCFVLCEDGIERFMHCTAVHRQDLWTGRLLEIYGVQTDNAGKGEKIVSAEFLH